MSKQLNKTAAQINAALDQVETNTEDLAQLAQKVSKKADETEVAELDEVTAAALVETRDYIDSLLNGITTRGKILMSKDIVNTLTGVSSLVPLSAFMGRKLNDYAIENEEVIAAAINDMNGALLPTAIAPVYKTYLTYAVGAIVMNEGNLWKCISAVEEPEFFDSEKWQQTNVIEILNNK